MNSYNKWICIFYEFNGLNRWIHRINKFIYYVNSSIIDEFIHLWIHSFYEFICSKYMNSFNGCMYEFIYSMNLSVQNEWIQLIVVRAKPKLWAHSVNCEGKARAASAERELQELSPSTPPAPTRPRPAAPINRVHLAAPIVRVHLAAPQIRLLLAAPIVRVHPATPTSYGTFAGGLG